MDKEEVRKGPWTEQEDAQLLLYVNLFGDRRWDFIAQVSGLKRAGKSCRLRWVNYLHPGLKRGKMTPHEERLVLELHSKWGNRWSRIARKLPGRTDNEIKNYWRTHMRKKAQDQRKKVAVSHSSPSSSSSDSFSSSTTVGNATIPETDKGRSFYDTGGKDSVVASDKNKINITLGAEDNTKVYSIDDIWKDIELSEDNISSFPYCKDITSPVWDSKYCATDSLWSMDGEERNVLMPQMGDDFHSFPFNKYNMTG